MDYDQLLSRVREKVPQANFCGVGDRFKMPVIDSFVEGNRTISTNMNHVSKYLNRDQDHLVKFIAKELATSSLLEKGDRVLFAGKFPNRVINQKLELYVQTYVRCKECCGHDTKLEKDDRIQFVHCMTCQARRPVPKIT